MTTSGDECDRIFVHAFPLTPSGLKRIYFCRHGETDLNSLGIPQGGGVDYPLNERGKQQAACLRNLLRNVKVDVIISSQLIRAKETAEIISQAHPRALFTQFNELAEIGWGDWEGKEGISMKPLLEQWSDGDFEARSPNGESPKHAEERSVPIIYDILKRKEQTFVIVAHGRLLRVILSSILHHSLEMMSSFTHHNACVNVVDAVPVTTVTDLLEPTSKDDTDRTTIKRKSSYVKHPKNFTFQPVVLDYRAHLTPDLRNDV